MTELKQVIPEGYKKTEIGIIPADWNIVELGNISTISRLAGAEYTSIWEEKENGEIIALRGFNIGKNKINHDQIVRISDVLSKRLKRSRLCKGDVVYPCVGTIGNAAVIYEDDKYHIQQNIARISPSNKDLLSEFLVCFLISRLAEVEMERFNSSSSQPNVLVSSLRQYRIPLPASLKEQTAIANALSDVDALISELEKLIAKKQAIKTATMQQLLTGKTRLPEFALREDGTPKGYKTSELGEIPEDWEVAPLRDFIKIRHGRNQKAVESLDGKYPIFATGGQIGTANSFLYDKPSVLIGRKGTIDKPRYAEEPFWTVDTLFYSEVFKTADAKFIFYKVCMIDWMQYSEASGVPSLNASTIESVLAVFPERDEQTAIATVLSDIDEEIKTLQQRLNKTRQIKQGMMQELLTGKTRLIKTVKEEQTI